MSIMSMGQFEIEHGDDKARLHVTFGDVYVIINHTAEGVVIDVVNNADGEVVGTLCIDNDTINGN